MNAPACHYCSTTASELRPYGPGGSWTCFPCATATPEREAITEGALGALLQGAHAISPTGAVVIGEASGPRPAEREELE